MVEIDLMKRDYLGLTNETRTDKYYNSKYTNSG